MISYENGGHSETRQTLRLIFYAERMVIKTQKQQRLAGGRSGGSLIIPGHPGRLRSLQVGQVAFEA